MDPDGELLERVNRIADFFGSVFERDTLEDWNLAKQFGGFLVRILPPNEIMGHVLLVRACRHLGERDHAMQELQYCRSHLASRQPEPWEVEMLLPALATEEKLLS